jgi:hypothetical protein
MTTNKEHVMAKQKITIGYEKFLGVGDPTVVEANVGTPITIEGLSLTLSVRDGVLTIHGGGNTTPEIRPVSGNEIKIRAASLFGDF